MQKNENQAQETLTENELLLREGKKIAKALAEMFAPTCEVVLHDLTNPQHSVVAIEQPLSGRNVGDAMTEMGLARIRDPNYPDVVQNYANRFPDGRPAKSTSVGLRNSQGEFVAALCLNMDVSLLDSVQRVLAQLTAVDNAAAPTPETLRSRFSPNDVKRAIEDYSAAMSSQPRALTPAQRKTLIRHLATSGLLQLRGGAKIVAEELGISRASVYNALKGSAAR